MELRSEMKRRLWRAGDPLALVDEYERAAETLEDPAERSRRLYQIGEICEELLLRKDRAMLSYQKSFKIDRNNTDALRRARSIYREMGNLEMVLKLGELELKFTEEAARRADIFGEMGLAHLDLGNRDAAIDALETAHAVHPDDPRVSEALVAARAHREGAAEAIAAFEAQLAGADSNAAAWLYLRIARVRMLESPADPEVETNLSRCLANDPHNDGASYLLEQILAKRSDWDAIVQLHERRAYAAADEERSALYRRFASTWEVRWGDRPRAARFYHKALQEFYQDGLVDTFPGHVAAFGLLRDVYTSGGAPEPLLDLAEQGMRARVDDLDKALLAVQAGLLAWRSLSDVSKAKLFFARAQALAPELEEIRALEKEIGPLPTVGNGTHQESSGEGVVQAEEHVVDSMPLVVELQPPPSAEPPVVAAPAADSVPLVVELQPPPREVPVSEPAAPAAMMEEVVEAPRKGSSRGRKRRGTAESPQPASPPVASPPAPEPDPPAAAAPDPVAPAPQAVAAEPPAMQARPQDPPAASAAASIPAVQVPEESYDDKTTGLIEQARKAEAQGIEKGIDAWRKVVQAAADKRGPRRELGRLYRQAERWNALVEVLKEEAERTSGTDKIAILFEMVAVYREKLRLDVMVVQTYNQILQLDPRNVAALDALATQWEAMKRWPDLIGALQKRVVLLEDPREKVALYLRIAGLYHEKFSNQAEAIKAYEAALELDPRQEGALAYLKQAYEKRRDWEKLINVHLRELDRMAEAAGEGAPDPERIRRHIEVARLASEKLKKTGHSIDLWKRVLALDPHSPDALAELEKLYEREKTWGELARVLEAQLDISTDNAKKSQILQKLGILYTDKVHAADGASNAWRRLLEIEPENRRAQDSLKKIYLEQKAWDDLERFYAGQQKWEELIRVLERQVDSEEPTARRQLHLKIGSLYRDRLGKPDRAMRAYERVLQLDEGSVEIAQALIPLYEQSGDHRKLVSVLEIELGGTEPGPERVRRLTRIAELSESALRDKTAAFNWWLKVFAEDPTSSAARAEVERLAAETNGFPALVAAYEAAAERVSGPDKLPLLSALARAYEHELSEFDKAIVASQGVLELDPENHEAVDALERLYLATERFGELLKIYETKLSLASDPTEKKEIRYKIAHLYEEEAADRSKAIRAYEALLAESGEELPALRALDRIYEAEEQWQPLADVIERELRLCEPDNQDALLELKFRLGNLRERHLSDVTAAIESYRDILATSSAHEGARRALERRLEDPEHQLTVSTILEPIYETLEDWRRLIEVYEIQLARESSVGRRVDLLLRIGELYATRVMDGEKAFAAFSRCFREDPSCEKARVELERLAAIQEVWPQLVGLYERACDKNELSPDLQRELLLKIAVAYDEKIEDAEKAIHFYRRVLGVEPDNMAALESLDKLLARNERWGELLEVYRKKAELAKGAEERQKLLFQIAYLQEEMLATPDEAITTYKDILGDDPENRQALRALDRLYQGQQSWHELADNLARQLSLSDTPAETVELLVRLAALREQQLGEVAAAIDTYRQVLEQDAGNQEAVRALERLFQMPEHELQVATILEPVYRGSDEWQKIVAVYEVMVKHALDPARKIELLLQIGELYEVAGDDANMGFAAYGRALQEDPGLSESQTRFERLARTLDRWEDAVALYQQLGDKLVDEEQLVTLWMKVARLLEEQLHADERAAAAYEKVLEISPRNLDAVGALEQIHLRTDNHPRLVEVILRKVDIVETPDEKKELLFRAAQIYEEVLGEVERAIEVHRQVLDLDESDKAALAALERLYTQLEQWEPLKDVFRKRVELTESVPEKKRILYVLGQVYEEHLEDQDKAIETYQAILDLDAEDRDAITALERLYQRSERWHDLLQILEREVELAGSTAETVSIKHRIGLLWENELGDLTRAVEAYREVLSLDSNAAETLQALDRIVHGDKEPLAAAAVLEPIYETGGEWDRLVDVYEVMATHADDPNRKIKLLHKMGDVCERRIENPSAAFLAYGRALHEDSTNERTLMNLERLAEQTGAFVDLARLYEEEVDKILDATQQVDMMLRLARVYEEELGEREKAIPILARVLDAQIDNRTAIEALDRLYTGTERWSDLAEILRKQIHLAGSNRERVIETTFRLAQLHEQALEDPKQALECYREILGLESDHRLTRGALERMFEEGTEATEVAQILQPLYQEDQAWEKLARLQELQYERTEDPAERVQLVQAIAELYEQRLTDQPQAFLWWGRAYREQPTAELPVQELERLARATHAWEELVAVYTDVAGSATEPEAQRAALLGAARVYDRELHDRVRAEEAYLRVLSLDDKDKDALEALDRIYAASSMFQELADVLRRRIEVTEETDTVVALSFRLATLYSDTLYEDEAAVECLNSILEIDSRNPRALEALEQVYFKREAWQDLYGIYEKRVDIAESDMEMAECYARMAKIASDALEDSDKAMDLWGRVVDLRGEDLTAILALADLYERAEMWQELVDLLERGVQIAQSPEQKTAVHKRLGRIWGEKRGKDRNALDHWLKALELAPHDVETLRAVAGLYRSTQAWSELIDTLHRLIEIGTGGDMPEGELKELYAQLGELQGEMLMRPQEAIEAWQNVLQIDPTDFRALSALERLFTQEARWEECIEILQRKADALEHPTEQIDVLLQAAQVWEDRLDEPERAGRVYERVLSIDASNMTASHQLEQIYRNGAQWEKLIELLLSRVEHTGEAAQRIEILQSVAKIYEAHLDQPDAAFVALQAAFREDYSNDSTAKELERLASSTGKWNDLLTEYTQVVQTIPDPKTAADLWVKIGRWYGEELGHMDYAIASEQQALALDADHAGALAALADFYRKTQRWPELVSILAKHAEVEEDTEKKVELLVAMAELWENQLGDINQAVAAYQEAIEVDVGCVEALDALERLYRRMEQWDALIDILTKKSLAVEETEEVIRLKHRIGELWEERIGDASRAIEMYKDILTVDPQNLEALKALEKLYEKTGQMEAYLDVLEQQLDVSGTDSERISLYERMATAWEEQFQKPERAWECFEKILLIDDRRESAYRALERIYRQQRRWEELVEAYRRHINAINDPGERTELYAQMGQVYDAELKDSTRAIEAYLDILSFDPDHTQALAQLGTLYEQTEEWERAIDRMSQLVQITDDAAERVALHYRIGRIYDERLGDPEAAETRYMEALALDTAHVPTLLSLVRMYDQRGDWFKAASMRIRAEAHTANAMEKARLLLEAAKIHQEHLDDEAKAAELYARTLDIDPELVEAGEPLADIYFRNERWQELEPVLDMLVRKVGRKDARELNQLYYRLARTSDELGSQDKALKYYKLAYDLDSTYLPTLLGRAALLFKMADWDQAFKIYQTILVHHRDSQKEAEIVDIFYRLGQIKLKLGERKKALNMFEKALEVDPHHRDTLLAVIELHAQQNDYEAVVHAKRSLLAPSSAAEKARLLDEIGDIYREKLANPQKAITAYLEVLENKPDDHVVQHKVLELYTETKQWKKAIEILSLVIQAESDAKRRAKYWYTAAVISRDELKSADEAIDYFNRALDDDPDLLRSFEAIDKICTGRKDFKQQERNYRKMIKRTSALPETPERKTALIALWHALGEIYRSRLRDYASAMASFEVAASLEPENLTRHEILAELYQVAGGDALPKAVREHQVLIKANPFRIESYKAMRRIYMDTRQYDKAWCVCAALTFLKKADAEEQQFFEQYRQKGFVRAKQRLTDELWAKAVFHPDEDRYIGAIFGAVWQVVATMKSAPHKNFGLKRKDKLDIASNQLLFAKVFNYVNQVLGVVQPELYLRPEQPMGMQLVNANEKGMLIPSFVVGSDLLQGRPEKELAFAVARSLAFLRPEHYLRLTLQTVTELKVVFQAALKLVNPKLQVKGDPGIIDQYVQAMARGINPAWLEQLAIVVGKFVTSRGEADLNRFALATDLTVARVGFILCNDLEVAAKMISQEPVAVGGVTPKDKIKELVLYSISEEYFLVRQQLGLAIGQ